MKQQYQAYVQASHTVSKTKQIVMLYDGTIRFLQQAKEAIRDKRIEDRYRLLLKASEVIYGLQSALDFENGGYVAKVLYNFYSSIDMKILNINHTNSMEACDAVISDLKQMRDVWADINANSSSSEVAPVKPQETVPQQASNEPPANITLSA